MPNDPLAVERAIRKKLAIPDTAQQVLLLGAAPHMDWDWLYPFQGLLLGAPAYKHDSANTIITTALGLIRQHYNDPSPYYYSICEMGFFRATAALPQNSGLLKNFKTEIGDKLGIQGGGITSPDNFLPHGEAFIRDYLLGKVWLRSAGIDLPQGFCYIPDDFGSDSQLPVVVQALGFSGVSFSRIPETLANQITAADFVWTAADGSSAVAHWEQAGYCQGNGIDGDSVDNIYTYIGANSPTSPTPYMFVPCGCDFSTPIADLVDIATNWNKTQYGTGKSNVYVVVATLGMFLTLIETYVDPNVQHPYGKYTNLAPGPFAPSPYWTGYYASRPANKILHHRAVRALLAAETFGKIAVVLQTNDNTAWLPVQTANRDAVNQGWEALEPSTHHDYITGTARDPVYTGEQLPLLGGAVSMAEGARATAISQIAGLVAASPNTGEVPVAIFNPLGLDRAPELVELPAQPGLAASSVRDSSGNLSPVQIAANGALLFQAAAPSLGYASVYLNTQSSTTPDPVSVTAAPDQSWFTLSNNQLSVTISRSANWAITSFHPTGDIELTPKDGYPNDLVFYSDQGNIYNFGIEFGDEYFTQVPNDQVLTAGDGAVLESGPLRARVTTQVTFENNQCVAVYTREYTLVSGESQVRISCTGAAPINPAIGATDSDPYSVMVRFPWAGEGSIFSVKMVSISRATAFHWDDAPPAAYWTPPLFVATHDFVVPQSSLGSEFPAIYHRDVPAWAIDASGSLIACLFRNTPGLNSPVGRGANGTDSVVTTHCYAVRVPQAQTAASLALLTQARCFQNPLLPVYANVPEPFDDSPSLTMPPQFSLAAVTSGTAFITAAKSGQFDPAALVLRVYQPTNSHETVTISLAGYIQAYGPVQVAIATALEDQLPGVATLPVKNNSVTFTMNQALTTLLITKVVP